jgi:hypothetical protein
MIGEKFQIDMNEFVQEYDYFYNNSSWWYY